jgi:superfamily I DNA/RNA helicase
MDSPSRSKGYSNSASNRNRTTQKRANEMTTFDTYQLDAIEAINLRKDLKLQNLFICARAGSGKTTILIEACKQSKTPIRIIAFNKVIADEFTRRLAKSTKGQLHRASTLHSLALSYFPKKPIVNARKIPQIIKKHLGITDEQYQEALEDLITKLRSYGTESPEYIKRFISESFDLPLDLTQEEVYGAIETILKETRRKWEEENEIDFDEMLFYPLEYGWKIKKEHRLFVDEVQDFNPIQIEWLSALRSNGGQIVCAGDPFQSIYGFRGASANACDQLVNRFGLETKLMPTTYRCFQQIAKLARTIVRDLEVPEWQQQGEIDHLFEPTQINRLVKKGETTFILARNHRYLIPQAIKFLKEGTPFTYNDQKLERQLFFWLKNISKHMKNDDPSVGAVRSSISSFLSMFKGGKKKEQYMTDLADVWLGLIKNAKSMDKASVALKTLKEITRSKNTDLEIATIHRAKGREAEHVIFIAPEVIPSQFATTPAEIQQETNLLYIAITRAIKKLTLAPNNMVIL